MSETMREKLCGELDAQVDAYAAFIAPVYAALDWVWMSATFAMSVPDAPTIARTLRDLLKDIRAGNSNFVSTGGLTVWIDADEEKCGINFKDEHQYFGRHSGWNGQMVRRTRRATQAVPS